MADTKIGLLGGTFDPLHRGHLRIAQKSMQVCELDRVVFILCRQSPHKEQGALATDALRFKILQQLMELDEKWECSDWEIKQDTPSYSVDTLRFFKDSWPDAQLFWIMGCDQWQTFANWKDPDQIVAMADLIICQRPSYEMDGDLQSPYLDCVHWVKDVNQDVASKNLRQDVKQGRSIEDQVPEQVMRWIKENQLYGYRCSVE